MVVIVEPELEARRSVEKHHGFAGVLRALGGGHVGAAISLGTRRSVEERHGFAGVLRALGDMGGRVWAAMSLGTRRSVEERHGFAGVLRALGGMGGRVWAPHVLRVKGLAACARSVTATTRGVGKLVK